MKEIRIARIVCDTKEHIHERVDQLPDNAIQDDAAYRHHVRASIERGLEDAEAGRIMTTSELRSLLHQ